jgi:cytochrome oxidase Cu insertion factor (SCO1/SenC/PrrC family)
MQTMKAVERLAATVLVVAGCVMLAGCVMDFGARHADGSAWGTRWACLYAAQANVSLTDTNGKSFKLEGYKGDANAEFATAITEAVKRIPTGTP